jgi:competence protein ComEA
LAAALLGGSLMWYGNHGRDDGIPGWQTLNASMAQAIAAEENNKTDVGSKVTAESSTTAKPSATAASEQGNAGTSATVVTPPVPAPEGRINVNTASAAELMDLPGIGGKKAEAIIEYRKSHGNFSSLADLGNVKGIGDKMLEKLKPMVSF